MVQKQRTKADRKIHQLYSVIITSSENEEVNRNLDYNMHNHQFWKEQQLDHQLEQQ
jgi:hypothetical protein